MPSCFPLALEAKPVYRGDLAQIVCVPRCLSRDLATRLMMIAPMEPRRIQRPIHFFSVQGLCQDIPGSKVQGLGPQPIVRETGYDDQKWRIWQ
jgi:hypothetical protein